MGALFYYCLVRYMKSQTAQNIMKFLARLDLKGAEVPAFIEAMHALEQICLDTPESRALDRKSVV